jgi:hypothetical protein
VAKSQPPESIDQRRFEKIVVEGTIQLLAERAEETPYTVIINCVDPLLAKHGFFHLLDPGIDVKSVLEKHLDQEFKLVPGSLGSVSGQLWWFTEASLPKHLSHLPLYERVEQTVLRILRKQGRVTFTDVWKKVGEAFPNALTTDSTSIKDALKTYARPVASGNWLLKPEIGQRESQHNEIIGILAEVGLKRGFKIWVGVPEQAHSTGGIVGVKKLKSYVTANPKQFTGISDLNAVRNIDLLWIKNGGTIAASFDVEATTPLTEALRRGSNLPHDCPKYLVLPDERSQTLIRKMRSPLFDQHFREASWKVLFFDELRGRYKDLKAGKVKIEDVAEKKTLETVRQPSRTTNQITLEFPE